MFSNREAARYLETLKAYETKPADAIKERLKEDYYAQVLLVLFSFFGFPVCFIIQVYVPYSSLNAWLPFTQ